MAEKLLDPMVVNFGLSYAIVAIVNALLVVIKEEIHSIHDWMASIPPLNHHWGTHGIFLILIFFFMGWLFSYLHTNEKLNWDYTKLGNYIVLATALDLLIIFLYFFIAGVLNH